MEEVSSTDESGVDISTAKDFEELKRVIEYMEKGAVEDYGLMDYLEGLREEQPEDYMTIHSMLVESESKGAREYASLLIKNILSINFDEGVARAEKLAVDENENVRDCLAADLDALIRGGEYRFKLSVSETIRLMDIIYNTNKPRE